MRESRFKSWRGNQFQQWPWARQERGGLQNHYEPGQHRHGHPSGLRIMAVFDSATFEARVRFPQSARGHRSKVGYRASNAMTRVRISLPAPILRVSSNGRAPASNPGNVRSIRTTRAKQPSSSGRKPDSHSGNAGFNSRRLHHDRIIYRQDWRFSLSRDGFDSRCDHHSPFV